MIEPEIVEAAFDDITSSDPYIHRSPVGASMIGGCRRQAAYAIRDGWPEDPGESTPAAYLGGAIHDKILPDLAQRFGVGPESVEPEVTFTVEGLTIVGHPDLVVPGGVLDVKTVSQWYYPVVQSRTPLGHKMQLTGYALATDAVFCTLLYINRSATGQTPEDLRFAVTFDVDEHEADLRRWVREVQDDPDNVPRDERGPGLSFVCDGCPWARECWGEWDEYRAPQSIIRGELGTETAAEEYDRAREMESTAKQDKAFWRAVLEGEEPGNYEDWILGWSGGGPGEPVVDVDEAVSLLEDFGLPIPYRESKPRSPSISVRRRKPPKPRRSKKPPSHEVG